MKRILITVSLFVAAAGCAAPPTNRDTSATTSNTNVATAAKPASRVTESEIMDREKAAWDAIKRKDYEGFGNMLAADQIYVAGDGINDKASTISGIKGFEPTDITFADWKVLSIDKDAVVVTSTVTVKGTSNGQTIPPSPQRTSTAWVNRDGKWLSIYHQDCELKTAPTPGPPQATPSKPAKAATTPATVAQPGNDAVANEKMVWETIKNKNSDAFAAFLSPDSIEVEPDGVFDKAGSVKTVEQIDLSKAVTSDFKSVKFDDDATLVTYLVKGPGIVPEGERHSTIWANRGGKWMAVFHHGSPVMKPTTAAKPKPPAK